MAEAIHKLFRRLLGKVGIEGRKDRPSDAVRPQQLRPLGEGEQRALRGAPEKSGRVGFERVSDRHEVPRRSFSHASTSQSLMTEMNAVKHAERHASAVCGALAA